MPDHEVVQVQDGVVEYPSRREAYLESSRAGWVLDDNLSQFGMTYLRRGDDLIEMKTNDGQVHWFINVNDGCCGSFRYPSERLEAAAIVTAYVSGMDPPHDGWHHIDNAHNDLLREVIKQLVAHIAGRDLYEGEPRD